MAIALKKEVQKKGSLLDSNSNESPMQTIITRQSPDLFIGLCGFAGCGMKTVNSVLSKVAKSWNYDVVHIRISDLMQDPLYFEKKVIEENDDLNKERHIRMQKLANGLRRHYKKKELLAEAAITYIKSKERRQICKNKNSLHHRPIKKTRGNRTPTNHISTQLLSNRNRKRPRTYSKEP